ncbi:MAG: ester cyclase [Williamsia sp.]|nr:ester cyclase [Williamsia sp.]
MSKPVYHFNTATLLLPIPTIFSLLACNSPQTATAEHSTTDSVAANIKMYTHGWDEIINHHRLDMFNDSNFTKDVVMHVNPDKAGIDSARAYYASYPTGFSNISFTIKDVFGMDNKLVKHWNFKGTHTGVFLGIPPTGNKVDIGGVTLVRMEKGCRRTGFS